MHGNAERVDDIGIQLVVERVVVTSEECEYRIRLDVRSSAPPRVRGRLG